MEEKVGMVDQEVMEEEEVMVGMGMKVELVTALVMEEVGMVAQVEMEEMVGVEVMEDLEDRVEMVEMLGREDLVSLKQKMHGCLCWLKLTA